MIKKIGRYYTIWIVFVCLVIFLSTKYLKSNQAFPQYFGCGIDNWKKSKILCSLANFDGVHYTGIAKFGYANFEQAFFPFYPLLIKFLSPIFHGNYFFSGLFISHLSLLVSLFLLYRLVRLDYSDNTAKWTIFFMLCFPTSFFFGAVYTESLFLMLTLLSFYNARTNKWWLAGIAGGLASATRLVGIFLLPALIVEYCQKCKMQNAILRLRSGQEFKMTIQNSKIKRFKLLITNYQLLFLLLIPLGLLSYMFYLWKSTGDPLMFIHSQTNWQRQTFIIFPQVIYRYLKIILSIKTLSLINFVSIIELTTTIFILITIILNYKKIKNSYLIYILFSFFIPTLSGTLMSMPRFALTLFPFFVIIAGIKSILFKIFLIIFFILVQIILLINFSNAYFVA